MEKLQNPSEEVEGKEKYRNKCVGIKEESTDNFFCILRYKKYTVQKVPCIFYLIIHSEIISLQKLLLLDTEQHKLHNLHKSQHRFHNDLLPER